MPAPVTLADLDAKRLEIEALMQQVAAEKDEQRATQLTAELARRAADLEALGAQVVEDARHTARLPGRIEVVLTQAQRDTIRERTGVDLESFIEKDDLGAMARAMPGTDPSYIEALAIKLAERVRATREAEAALREELERTFRALEEAGVPELTEMVARLRAARAGDPLP